MEWNGIDGNGITREQQAIAGNGMGME